MGKYCQGITVHAVSFEHRGGPAFYTSLPGDGELLKKCRANGAGHKNRLISILLDHVTAMENPFWKCRYLLDRAAFPIHVGRDPLGKPHLLLGDKRGPAISFSEGGGKVWAALSADESDIGIDVAAAGEFQGKYPLHRVFRDQELRHALELTGGDLEMASALLWSIKEAFVKALGCGFHLVGPQQVHVCPSTGGAGEHAFPVCLSKIVPGRSFSGADLPIRVRSFPLAGMWLSIACRRRQCQGCGNDVDIIRAGRQTVDS
jgi:phosphopantetheinyl transferase (holo-ACP synthase)